MFKDILAEAWPTIETAAPFLATILGGPVASAPAGIILHALGSAFGITEPQKINTLPQAMVADPNCSDKLSEFDQFLTKWFKGKDGLFKMPTDAEVDLKLHWDK